MHNAFNPHPYSISFNSGLHHRLWTMVHLNKYKLIEFFLFIWKFEGLFVWLEFEYHKKKLIIYYLFYYWIKWHGTYCFTLQSSWKQHAIESEKWILIGFLEWEKHLFSQGFPIQSLEFLNKKIKSKTLVFFNWSFKS